MRFSWILTLALVALTVGASAQQRTKPVKPSHEEKARSGGAVKAPTQRNSNAAELQKLEQQTAKSALGQKSSGRPHVAPVRTQREKSNPPIHFGSTNGHGEGEQGAANSSKSRVRTKGSKH